MPESASTQPIENDHFEALEQILKARDGGALVALLELIDHSEVSYTLGRMNETARTKLLGLLSEADPELAADLMEHFVDEQAADFIDDLAPEQAAAIVEEMDSADQADVLGEMEPEDAEAILAKMDPEEAADAEAFMAYEDETAGGLMIDEVLSVQAEQSVAEVVESLRSKAEEIEDDDYEARYLYVLDSQEMLKGIVPLKLVLLAKPQRPISGLMIEELLTVQPSTDLNELEDIFDHVGYNAIPVVDHGGKLMGVVQRFAVHEALAEQGDEELAKVGGIIGGEELRSMGVIERVMRRGLFLLPIEGLLFLSALVILQFEHVIDRTPAIAAFLPVVAGICGSGGGQAVAVTMRELSLGLIRPNELGYVIRKELSVAILNAIVLGGSLALMIFLALTIFPGLSGGGASSMSLIWPVALAVLVVLPLAVAVGGSVPLVLKKLGMDPAMLSVPVVTTIVDMTAFMMVDGAAVGDAADLGIGLVLFIQVMPFVE